MTRRAQTQQHIWFRSLSVFLGSSSGAALTVLTADSPVTWTAHTLPRLPRTRVAVGAVLEAGQVTVGPPEALRTRLAAAGA